MLIEADIYLQQVQALQTALSIVTTLNVSPFHAFPPQATVIDGAVYDFIIVGAGTAGSVIANRLAEANASVLVIEAGSDPQLESMTPSLILYMKNTTENWNYSTRKDNKSRLSVDNSSPDEDDMSLGKQLGGTSSLCYEVYSPGSKYDYNDWAKRVNDSLWSWNNVLPYLKKTQKLQDEFIKNSPSGKFFGYNGNVGLVRSAHQLDVNLFDAFSQLGYERIPYIDGNTTHGYSDGLFSLADGLRQSTALAYLVPVKKYPKFHILKMAEVMRVLFNCNNTAVAVVAHTTDGRFIVIKARKEVILSAGVVNSAQLLMVSGVGPAKHLKSQKIKSISDLPVGQNFQDRLSIVVIYNFTNRVYPYKPWNPYKFPSDVISSYGSSNTSIHANDTEPWYQTLGFINYPKHLMRYCVITYRFKDTVCNKLFKTTTNSEMVFFQVNKQKYVSKGKILLKSADFRVKPIIIPNYFDKDEDLEDNAKVVQDFSKIEETKNFKEIGGKFMDPKLKECSGMDRKSIRYWRCYCRYMSSPQHHYTGTCAMGSVVDARLKVYGVNHLRVADASVIPYPTTGGTLGPTMLIGEVAAALIKKDHGL